MIREDAQIEWICGDPHIHSHYSSGSILDYDCPFPPELMLEVAAKRGLKWVAPTEHNTIAHVKKWEDAGKKHGITIVPGIEKSFPTGKKFWFWSGQFHVIILGIQEMPSGRIANSFADFCIWAKERGYLVVAPHPFSPAGMKKRAAEKYVDAIEIRNPLTNFFANLRAEKLCKEMNKIPVVGSDSHMPETLGCARVYVDAPQDARADDILQALAKGSNKNFYQSYNDIFLVYRLLRKRFGLNYDKALAYINGRKNPVERAVALKFMEYGLADTVKAKIIYLSVRSAWTFTDTLRSLYGLLGDYLSPHYERKSDRRVQPPSNSAFR